MYTYCVNPEQSNPLVVVPPYTYLHPKNCFAYDTTELPVCEAVLFVDDEFAVVAVFAVLDFDAVFNMFMKNYMQSSSTTTSTAE